MEDHKTKYNKVLNQFEMYYFMRDDEWRQHKQDPNIKRIKETAIITISNDKKIITIPSYTYLYTPKQLNIMKY